MSIESLLDRPIAFHRCFVELTGSVTAAILLSQMFYWSRRTKDENGWFYKTAAEWSEETGMGRYELENARKCLRKHGLMEESRRGVPAKLYFLLRMDVLQSRLLETSNQECGKPANKTAGNQQSITETTSENTSETTNRALSAIPFYNSFLQDLIVQALLTEEGFGDAWRSFVAEKKAIKEKLGPQRVHMLLKTLAQRPNQAAFALRKMIEKGWRSLQWEWLDPKPRANTPSPAPKKETVDLDVLHDRRMAEKARKNNSQLLKPL